MRSLAARSFSTLVRVDPGYDPGHVLAGTLHFTGAAAEAGQLVTFGIVPDRAETGYGDIRRAKGDGPVFAVAEFVEKPDYATAVRYVQSGEYYWNSGMFMFRASAFLAELKVQAPAILAACESAVAAASHDLDFTRLPAAE